MASNPYLRAARLIKVEKISDFLVLAGFSSGQVERATEQDWAQIARLAEVRTPSTETRAAVIARLKFIENNPRSKGGSNA